VTSTGAQAYAPECKQLQWLPTTSIAAYPYQVVATAPMYSPIGEAILLPNGKIALDDSNDDVTHDDHGAAGDVEETRTPRLHAVTIRILTVVIWATSILFATFTAIHYVRNAFRGHWKAWDSTDAGLYREITPPANSLMVIHFLAGIYLMLVGPIQLVKPFRQRFGHIHRIMGRIYITTALVASTCATLFVLIYGTPRHNRHEDVNNVLFGISVFVCAIQSIRHAALTKNIECHKRWSWRLYALILGVLLYRLYKTVYNSVVLTVTRDATESHPNQQHWSYNVLFYLLFFPNLIMVEYLWYRRMDANKSAFDVTLVIVTIVFVSVAGFHIAIKSWIPAILQRSSTASEYN
jgi:hypothetical protein